MTVAPSVPIRAPAIARTLDFPCILNHMGPVDACCRVSSRVLAKARRFSGSHVTQGLRRVSYLTRTLTLPRRSAWTGGPAPSDTRAGARKRHDRHHQRHVQRQVQRRAPARRARRTDPRQPGRGPAPRPSRPPPRRRAENPVRGLQRPPRPRPRQEGTGRGRALRPPRHPRHGHALHPHGHRPARGDQPARPRPDRTDPDPGAGDPGADRRARRHGPCPDRHRQDGGVQPADADPASGRGPSPRTRHLPSADPRAHARACDPDRPERRGLRPGHRHPRLPRGRRRLDQRAGGPPRARRRRADRDPRPPDRPDRAPRDPLRPDPLSGAGRGRPDARHRLHPCTAPHLSPDPGGTHDDAVLGHHAEADGGAFRELPDRSGPRGGEPARQGRRQDRAGGPLREPGRQGLAAGGLPCQAPGRAGDRVRAHQARVGKACGASGQVGPQGRRDPRQQEPGAA